VTIDREWAGKHPDNTVTNVNEARLMRVTVSLNPQTTLSEVLTWVQDRGLSSSVVVLSGGHLSFARLETGEEVTARVAAHHRANALADRSLVERYKRQFGNVPPDEVEL